MAFFPMPGDQLHFRGKTFSFIQHRVFVTPAPHAEKGARGTVYLVSEGTDAWALKVFKPPFRKPFQTTVATHLGNLKGLTGLRAAERMIIDPGDSLASTHKELAYAQLMPWIEGVPWSNVIDTGTRKNDCYLAPAHGFHLCARFLDTMASLEDRNCAHTDIAGGNVIVSPEQAAAELIDLEEMFGPGFPQPDRLNRGSAGYAHPTAAQGLWSADADRFAAIVMASEMLVLTHPDLATASDSGGGYFANDEFGHDGPRVRGARDYLRTVFPEFEALFGRAWHSRGLSECPGLSQAARVLRAYLRAVPPPRGLALLQRNQAPPWRPSSATRSTPPVHPPPSPQPSGDAVVSWTPLAPRGQPAPTPPVVVWDQASPIPAIASPVFQVIPPPPTPTPAPSTLEDTTIPMVVASPRPSPQPVAAPTVPTPPPAFHVSTPPAQESVFFDRVGVRVSSVTFSANGAQIDIRRVRSVVSGAVPPSRVGEGAVGSLGAVVLLGAIVQGSVGAALTAIVIICGAIGVALQRRPTPAVNVDCHDGTSYTFNVPSPALADEIARTSTRVLQTMGLPAHASHQG